MIYIPLLMIGGLLLLTLIVGLYKSHQNTTFQCYAVGNKRFSTFTLLATLLATAYGGAALMRYLPSIHNDPLKYILYSFMTPCVYWVLSLVAVRMGPFLQHLSLAETIGSVYGAYPRIITALLTIAASISIVTMQIFAMSSAISMCMDWADHRIIKILSTLILITYTTFGGIRGVVHTDVLQCIVFSIIICLFAKFAFVGTGKSWLEILFFLQNQEKFQCSYLCHDVGLLELVTECILLLLPMSNPAVMHRIYIASSPMQLRKVFFYGFLCSFLIQFTILSIGLFVFVMEPSLFETEVWPYILRHMPSAFKGSIVVCLLGMTMSTADSSLHLCSVMVSHDILESIRGVKKVSARYQIWVAKFASLGMGLLAMALSMRINTILTLARYVFKYPYMLFYATVAAPFILVVFGFRGTSRTALVGMATGVATILIVNLCSYVISDLSICVLGIVANGLAMMAAHYLLPQPTGKGWVGLDAQQKRLQQLTGAFKRFKKELDFE